MEGLVTYVLLMMVPLDDGGFNYRIDHFQEEVQCEAVGHQWQTIFALQNPGEFPQYTCNPIRHKPPRPGQSKSGYSAV